MRTVEYALVLLLIVVVAGCALHAVAGAVAASLDHTTNLIGGNNG
jgi:Flp pilus assembly pilin Flp